MAGEWSDKTLSLSLIKGRALHLMSDAAIGQFVPDVVTDDRTAAAKAEAEDRLFGSSEGDLARYASRVTGGVPALLDSLAANTQISGRVDNLLALCFLYVYLSARVSTPDSSLAIYSERIEEAIGRAVRYIERVGPAALGLVEDAGGSSTPSGGATYRTY